MAIPVELAVVVCVAGMVPPVDVTVVVIGDGVGSSGDSIVTVFINGIIYSVHIFLCYCYTSFRDVTFHLACG